MSSQAQASQEAARGPLRVLASNPRYFTDGSGRAVYLTGSHVWWNLVAGRTWQPPLRCHVVPRAFDYSAYLRDLKRWNHNFVRLWAMELVRWDECGRTQNVALHPWPRTGPGTAVDGRPRFDLGRSNPAYFRRLRARVAQAQREGIYVSVMLFEGWQLQYQKDWRWKGHPFSRQNNINNVEGDVNGDGSGIETHTLAQPRVTRIQEAYVRRVVDTLASFDNVLFEIANESGAYSTAWQYRMIDVIKRREAGRARRHPVGMTFQHAHGNHDALFRSRADWISPFGLEYLKDPPRATGRKVSVSDTDHHCGDCGDETFPWRNFLRGHYPIYMDAFDGKAHRVPIRLAMGQTRRLALRLDLAASRSCDGLTSTRFCLAVRRRHYVVLQPDDGAFSVDLRGVPGPFSLEWHDVRRAVTATRGTVAGGARVTLTAPFSGPAVAYLRRR
jgi:hypothetical protein